MPGLNIFFSKAAINVSFRESRPCFVLGAAATFKPCRSKRPVGIGAMHRSFPMPNNPQPLLKYCQKSLFHSFVVMGEENNSRKYHYFFSFFDLYWFQTFFQFKCVIFFCKGRLGKSLYGEWTFKIAIIFASFMQFRLLKRVKPSDCNLNRRPRIESQQ